MVTGSVRSVKQSMRPRKGDMRSITTVMSAGPFRVIIESFEAQGTSSSQGACSEQDYRTILTHETYIGPATGLWG